MHTIIVPLPLQLGGSDMSLIGNLKDGVKFPNPKPRISYGNLAMTSSMSVWVCSMHTANSNNERVK